MAKRTIAAAALLGAAFLLAPPAAVAGDGPSGRNEYYRYVDDNGVLHITNVRGRPGRWELYKSLPGSGTKGRGRPARGARRGVLPAERIHRYDAIIREAAARYDIPEALIRAVIHTESAFVPTARSRAGAMGLMQLMPATARFLGVRDPFDPRQNIHGGTRFLRLLADHFDGDLVLVVAAYNAGAGAVKKYGGIPPYAETRAYVRAVLRRYHAYERARKLEAAARVEPRRHLAP
ncbi:MAG: lytic transglycosylase domain-containing protein [Deltaproteobacteria bacterium]|nr:MAG: lytic transglycosylase domain-containing protein [Deltaproteobacteria bacterium]